MTIAMTRRAAAPSRLGALILCCLLAAPVPAQAPHGRDDAALPDPPPLAAATAEPMLGRIQVFDDWAVGCDNRLSCSAVSLVPEGSGTAYNVLVSIRRAGGPAGAGVIRLIGAEQLRGKIDLVADNRRLAQATGAKDMGGLGGGPAGRSVPRRRTRDRW